MMKKVISFLLSLCVVLSLCFTAYASDNMVLNISKDSVSHEVSDYLYGVSMEDIMYSCDGGLVADLVNNGSFEYRNDTCPAWDLGSAVTISMNDAMNDKNPSYAIVHCPSRSVTIRNNGYDSMSLEENVKYKFSCYVRNISYSGTIGIFLDSKKNANNIVQISDGAVSSSVWTELHADITSSATEDGSLAIVFDGDGEIAIDMVSLVPQNSYGYGTDEWKYTSLRPDMVESIRALKPSFIRFPGGCLVEGRGIDDIYSWKDTIGPLDSRRQHASVYEDIENGVLFNNTSAMGYHEYFQLCADLGARAVPVVGAGISCQNLNSYELATDAYYKLNMDDDQWSAYLENERGVSKSDISAYTDRVTALKITSKDEYTKYINNIALKPNTTEFTNFVQDILDLIEYANGDSVTTYWGALRAMNGHEQPFNIKYIAVGNENYGEAYDRNFDAIKEAVNEKYSDITLIRSADDNASASKGYIIDEHYVKDSEYLLSNNNVFDGVDRDSKGVMVGSFSSDGSDISSAVAECSFLTGVERNSDIVTMAAYSPVIMRGDGGAMISYDGLDLALSPSYFAQMIFANNTGAKYVNTTLDNDKVEQSVTVDENAQMIYIKLVNTSSSSQKLTVNLNGFDDISLVSNISVGHKYKDARNSVDKQTVAPETNEIEASNNSFDISLGGNSVNVVRVAYGENDGSSIWSVPDTIDTDTSIFFPSSAKVLMVVVVVGFLLGSAIGFFVYRRVSKRNRRRDDNV